MTAPHPAASIAASRSRPHPAEELAARLEHVASSLVGITKSGHGKKLLPPILDCVRELRAVWAVLRSPSFLAAALPPHPSEASAPPQDGDGNLHPTDTEGAASLSPVPAPCGRVGGAASSPRPTAEASANGPAGLGPQALQDRLTRVLSRAAFLQRLTELASQTASITGAWCLAIADIDHLSAVNHRHGSRVGDALLFQVAHAIQQTCDTFPGATVGRFGAEEFGVLLPRCSLPLARLMADEIRTAVARLRWRYTGGPVPLSISATVSLGLAQYRAGESAEELAHRALLCLERAKQAGRNTVVAEPPPAAAPASTDAPAECATSPA